MKELKTKLSLSLGSLIPEVVASAVLSRNENLYVDIREPEWIADFRLRNAD